MDLVVDGTKYCLIVDNDTNPIASSDWVSRSTAKVQALDRACKVLGQATSSRRDTDHAGSLSRGMAIEEHAADRSDQPMQGIVESIEQGNRIYIAIIQLHAKNWPDTQVTICMSPGPSEHDPPRP